jgi:hypothetical protein
MVANTNLTVHSGTFTFTFTFTYPDRSRLIPLREYLGTQVIDRCRSVPALATVANPNGSEYTVEGLFGYVYVHVPGILSGVAREAQSVAYNEVGPQPNFSMLRYNIH